MHLSSATITGRQHRLMQKNGHDYAITGQPSSGYAFGLVLDGCGSRWEYEGAEEHYKLPSQNEVGAKLIGQFTGQWLQSNLVTASSGSLAAALVALHESTSKFLANLVAAIPFVTELERDAFIFTHLMATIVGFAVTPFEASFFWSGDGYICQDGEVHFLDSRNQPDYLAHQLIFEEQGQFSQRTIKLPDGWHWLAVATDGWQADLLAELNPTCSKLELQRWVNIKARQDKYFEDDGAVAVMNSWA